MRRALPLCLLLLLPACTAELKEENNALNEQLRGLQVELAAARTARGALAVELQDTETRLVRLEAAARYGFDLTEDLWAVIETSMGHIICQLHPAEAPQTVDSFVRLAEGRKEWFDREARAQTSRPLYTDTVIYRVIPDTLFQAGSPTGQSDFSPGWTFPDELHPDRPPVAGSLAMANSGADSNGSQFFILAKAMPELARRHTVFGSCEPPDVIADLTRAPTPGPEVERPIHPPTLKRIVIHHGPRPDPTRAR